MVPKQTQNEQPGFSRDRVIRRKKTIVRTLLAFVTIANVLIFAYVGSIIYSVAKTSVVLDQSSDYTWNFHDGLNPNDDTIDYYLNLSITNQGLYPIEFITLDINMYVHNSTNELLIPAGTHFGTLHQSLPAIAVGTSMKQTLTLAVNPSSGIILGLNTTSCWMRVVFSIDTAIQQFAVHVNGTFYQPYP